MPARLVSAAVFKTVGRRVLLVAGGFDSHALPPFFLATERMSDGEPLACFDFDGANLSDALAFLKRTRSELRQLRMVRVWPDRFHVLDVNQDAFEIRGVGFADPAICDVLDAVDTVYKRDTIHEPTDEPYKEFKTGRRYPWARDRVM